MIGPSGVGFAAGSVPCPGAGVSVLSGFAAGVAVMMILDVALG